MFIRRLCDNSVTSRNMLRVTRVLRVITLYTLTGMSRVRKKAIWVVLWNKNNPRHFQYIQFCCKVKNNTCVNTRRPWGSSGLFRKALWCSIMSLNFLQADRKKTGLLCLLLRSADIDSRVIYFATRLWARTYVNKFRWTNTE